MPDTNYIWESRTFKKKGYQMSYYWVEGKKDYRKLRDLFIEKK